MFFGIILVNGWRLLTVSLHARVKVALCVPDITCIAQARLEKKTHSRVAMLGLGSRRLKSCLILGLVNRGFSLLLTTKFPFDRHCSILIFIGNDYANGVMGMLFRLVHCDARGDKLVDDGINVIQIPQRTENFSQAFTLSWEMCPR